MFQHYLKTAIRNLARERGYTLLNILGLSVGLMVSLLIMLWVQDEWGVDQFHEDGDRIYRTRSNLTTGEGGLMTWEVSPYPLLEYLPKTYPEIEKIGAYDPTNQMQFVAGDKGFLVDGLYASPGFFQVLSFPLLEGDISNAFEKPNSVLISENLAELLFGEEWQGRVLGKTLEINGDTDYILTGVFADVPKRSSIQFEFALNIQQLHPPNPDGFPWGNFDTRFLIKIKEEVEADFFASKVEQAINDNHEYLDDSQLILQPFERSYLHGNFENGKEAGGRIRYVRLFSLAAVFLLLIACINFMNMATARASRRSKEVGIRKTNGAARSSLISQFMIESFLITLISLALAIQLSEGILPYFRELTGKSLYLNFLDPSLWALLGMVGIGTALLAGSYPAFFLSSLRITHVLKGKFTQKMGTANLRRGLVVFQFVLSALLVVSALVVQQQVDYMSSKNLGYDKDNVLFFRIPQEVMDKRDYLATQLKIIPGVQEMAFTSDDPLGVDSQTGDPQWEGMGPEDGLIFRILGADYQFVEMMDIPMKEGRNFSPDLRTDSSSFIINETAAKAMKLGDPIGKTLEFWGNKGPIVGVVKDFHISSLHQAISPLIITNQSWQMRMAMMRIDPSQTESILAATERIFGQVALGHPFRYDFLEDRYMTLYRGEQRTSSLSKVFALVALFISCLGLLGLSTFIAEQRTKEIGIRKVLGASLYHIVLLLSRDFLKLVLLALFIALPLGYYLMNRWLEDFAYQINISWGIFALTVFVALGIAFLTVSFQSIRAALMDPIKSLRAE